MALRSQEAVHTHRRNLFQEKEIRWFPVLFLKVTLD